MRKKQIAVITLALWLTIIALFMLLNERIDFALFFILGFIGFLVIVELMEPRHVKPAYHWYIRLLIGVGIVLFIAFIAQKVLEMLGLEIVLG
jgi:predicted tellurium resistance membrane protein TerC